MEKLLDDYINKYQNNELAGQQVYNYSKHLDLFSLFLEKVETEYSLNHIEFNPSELFNNDFFKFHNSDINTSKMRFIEFLLLLQKKEYLKIKSIDFSSTQETYYDPELGKDVYKKYDGWKCILEINKTSREIKALEQCDISSTTIKNEEILKLALKDYTNEQIANELNIAVGTVKNILNVLFSTYGITGNTKGKRKKLKIVHQSNQNNLE